MCRKSKCKRDSQESQKKRKWRRVFVRETKGKRERDGKQSEVI